MRPRFLTSLVGALFIAGTALVAIPGLASAETTVAGFASG